MKTMRLLPIIFSGLMAYSISSYAECTNSPDLQTEANFPQVLNGKLVYHAYLNYGDGSSKLFLKNFRTNELKQLNQSYWNITDPMNAHFSPDGRSITFMGIQDSRWNVFIWTLDSLLPPINLTQHTAATGGDSEDPKFSTNGNYIVYKKSGDIAIMHLNQNKPNAPFADIIWNVTHNGYAVEDSMPYFSVDGNAIFYVQGAGANSDLYRVGIKLSANKLTVNKPTAVSVRAELAEYYPIINERGLLFVSWKEALNKNDQIYFLPSLTSLWSIRTTQLTLNDCNADNSDPIPIDNSHIIFSRARSGGLYHFYLGNINTGKVWSLDKFGVNDIQKNQLGTTYTTAY